MDDSAPVPARVMVAAATGVLRAEILCAFDEDFEALAVADVRAAEEAALEPLHALIVVADDLVNATPEELIHRVRLSLSGDRRLPVVWLNAHDDVDLLSATQAGAVAMAAAAMAAAAAAPT